MSKYRIIKTKKEGYYEYYRVQERHFFFVWLDESRAFNTLVEAQRYIKDQSAEQVVSVVHEE